MHMQDGPPNERKITKLCEYASKNPHRIPKVGEKDFVYRIIQFTTASIT